MLFLITGVGLVLFIVAVAALIAIVLSGQMDDLDTPPQRMLGEDAPVTYTNRQHPDSLTS